jgi:hypothetical protein
VPAQWVGINAFSAGSFQNARTTPAKQFKSKLATAPAAHSNVHASAAHAKTAATGFSGG